MKVIAKATEHARSEGRERVRPRDVAAVEQPRTEKASVCSLAVAAVRAWRDGTPEDLDAAMEALEAHLGVLVK